MTTDYVETVDAELAELEAKYQAADPNTQVPIGLQIHDLRKKRARLEEQGKTIAGEPITRDQVRAHVSGVKSRLHAFQQDQVRIQQAAETLARDPSAKVSTLPKVDRPDPLDGLDIKTPHQRRDFESALAELASESGPLREVAARILSGDLGDLRERWRELRINGDPRVWEYEALNPHDTWPEPSPSMADWEAGVLEGKHDDDALPFLDLAWRGELTFRDWILWAGDNAQAAARVQPRLGMVLRVAEGKGLIVRNAGPIGTAYLTRETGQRIEIPAALRAKDGSIAG